MFILPPALRALAEWRQFIIYHVVPSATRPGKSDKFPVDWTTGRDNADAHNPALWLDFETAARLAEMMGPDYGVGFVFTREAGFFFFDLDDCLNSAGTDWSDNAKAFLSWFPGAAVEVSLSGKGLHIIGRATVGEHRKKNAAFNIEFYTELRFCALTGISAIGDAATRHDAGAARLVAEYFAPDAGASPSNWTAEPCPEWRGPQDDADLIRRALRSQSAASVFGGKACFADLWEANADKLAAAFPDAGSGRAYDESRVDAALAQHLAFWTGKNCERIQALMQQSALVREKWNREDYLPRTILAAVSRQHDVLQDKPIELPQVVAATQSALGPVELEAVPQVTSGSRFISAQDQIQFFSGCVYVIGSHRVLVPGGYLLKPEQFAAMYGGYSFPIDPNNEKIVDSAWDAFIKSQCFRSPRADVTCFRPELTPGAVVVEGGTRLANVWWPIETERAEGDPSPFLRHMEKLLPNEYDRAVMLAYMAAVVQYPGVKFQWWPILIGAEGNGKTLIITALTHCVGERYTHLPSAKDLGENGTKFTGWLANKLFVGLEEVYVAERREVLESLKPLITNARIEIQGKGADQVTGDNRANGVACSNHRDAIPLEKGTRRWGIFYTGQMSPEDMARDGMTGDYFPRLYDWFRGQGAFAGQTPGKAIINWYLRNYTIPDELNPATQMHRAPETSSTAEARELSLGAIEQEVLEQIEQNAPGFAGGWISSMAFDRLITRLRMDRKLAPRRRHQILLNLGYILHPNLVNGRVNSAVAPDAGKPRLYIRPGSLQANFPDPKAVASAYQNAQSVATTQSQNFNAA